MICVESAVFPTCILPGNESGVARGLEASHGTEHAHETIHNRAGTQSPPPPRDSAPAGPSAGRPGRQYLGGYDAYQVLAKGVGPRSTRLHGTASGVHAGVGRVHVRLSVAPSYWSAD